MVEVLKTIPSRYYTDPNYFRIDKEKVFYRTWQFVCHETEISEPGSFQTALIADESIIVLRDQDKTIRAFYNVCRHRAHRIVEGKGTCKRLVCPYHVWTYELDGSLAFARGTEAVDGFDPGSIRLQSVRLENFCGLILVNLDDNAQSLDEMFPGLRQEISEMKPALSKMILAVGMLIRAYPTLSTYHKTNGMEDQSLVGNVQLGLESRSYDTGALILPPTPAAESEHGVAFFQKKYLEVLGE